MAGHSHAKNVMHRKAAQGAKKAQAFGKLVAAGRVRVLGASNFSAARLESALATSTALGLPRYEVMQPHYNLMERGIEAELIPACMKHGLAVAPYFALAAGHPTGVLAFTLNGLVGQWTKRATLAAFHADDPAMRAREMVAATALVFRIGPETLDLVREWESRMRNVSLIDDSPSPMGEHPEFRSHRHDQSIFTLLAHERALQRIPDETWFGDEWDGFRQFPIHARRWRHTLPWSQAWMRHGLWRV